MEATISQRTIHVQALILAPFLMAMLLLLYFIPPLGQDWLEFFQPATLAMLRGDSPYIVKDFHNAPWTLIPFIPFALLPDPFGRLGMFVLGFAGFAFTAFRLKAGPVSMILFLTSYPVVVCLYEGGMDWLPMLAFVTPAPTSLLFAATKPQVGLGISLYWLVEAWSTGGIRRVVRDAHPFLILLSLSFALYGFWINNYSGKWNSPVNIALFPYLIPVGIYLLSVRRKQAAMAASICFSPYFTYFSLSAPLAALLGTPRLLFAAWLILWVYPLMRLWLV